MIVSNEIGKNEYVSENKYIKIKNTSNLNNYLRNTVECFWFKKFFVKNWYFTIKKDDPEEILKRFKMKFLIQSVNFLTLSWQRWNSLIS